MRKIVAVAALSASAVGLSAGVSSADYTLNILHINDWHSRIESNNAYESTCSDEEETEGKDQCPHRASRYPAGFRRWARPPHRPAGHHDWPIDLMMASISVSSSKGFLRYAIAPAR